MRSTRVSLALQNHPWTVQGLGQLVEHGWRGVPRPALDLTDEAQGHLTQAGQRRLGESGLLTRIGHRSRLVIERRL
jgi:hypothetical protein